MTPSRSLIARDLRSFEDLRLLGWTGSVRSFQRLMVALGACAAVTVIAAASLGARAALDVLGDAPHASATVVGLFVAATVYVSAISLARELFSRRREVVAANPHERVFRALDISAVSVFWWWAAAPLVQLGLMQLCAGGGVLMALGSTASSLDVAVVVAAPIAGTSILLATAVRSAGSRATVERVRVGGWWRAASLVALAAVLAGVTARVVPWIATMRRAGSAPIAGDDLRVPLLVGALVLLGFGIVTVAMGLGGLSRRPFPLVSDAVVRPRRARTVTVIGWVAASGTRAVLHGRSGRLLRRWLAGWLLVSATVVPARAVLGDLPAQIGLVVGFMSALAVTEASLAASGPTARRVQARVLREVGAHATTVSVAVVVPVLAAGASVGAAVAVTVSLLAGTIVVGPFLAAVAVAGSGVLADALLPGRELADGSVSLSMPAAMVGVVLPVPVLIAAAKSSTVGDLVAGLIVIAIVIGGGACAHIASTRRV